MNSSPEPGKRPVKRRARGGLKKPAPFGIEIEAEKKQRFDSIAKRSGMTGALFLEAMIDNLELTDQGIPSWVPPLSRDGELPIDEP